MLKQCIAVFAVLGLVLLSTESAFAVDQERAQDNVQTQEQEQIYGSQLMTEQERADYRARIHAATTAEERERIRTEHHELMTSRAEERGVTLRDEPPVGGMGMGPGGMMGSGGGGMGPPSGR